LAGRITANADQGLKRRRKSWSIEARRSARRAAQSITRS